jgi:hypothetical protein
MPHLRGAARCEVYLRLANSGAIRVGAVSGRLGFGEILSNVVDVGD